MNKNMLSICCVLPLLATFFNNSALFAETYKLTDSSGTVHLSDNPEHISNKSRKASKKPVTNLSDTHYAHSSKRTNTIPSNQVYLFTLKSSNMEDSIRKDDILTISKNVNNIVTKDIVAYKYPEDPSKIFIGRIIGLPGSTVKMVNKVVYINNLKLIEKYAVNKDKHMDNPRDNNGPITLARDEYFILGDNRDRSYDCRFWNGSIKRTEIVGKVVKINGKNVITGGFK